MEDLGRLLLKGVLLGLVFSSMVGRPCSCCAPRQYIRGEATLEIPEIGAETAETSSDAEMHKGGPQRRILQILHRNPELLVLSEQTGAVVVAGRKNQLPDRTRKLRSECRPEEGIQPLTFGGCEYGVPERQ